MTLTDQLNYFTRTSALFPIQGVQDRSNRNGIRNDILSQIKKLEEVDKPEDAKDDWRARSRQRAKANKVQFG